MSESLRAKDNFEAVFERYSDTVYRLAYSRVKNPHDASDVTQDVFLKYIRAEKTYNDEEHIKAWLIKTTINTSKALVLSSWSRKRSWEELADDDTVCDGKTAQNTETKSALLSAVMGLPKTYRTVIHLFYFEDLPLGDISEITGQSVNTVKSRLYRARNMLKETLGDDFNDFS